jgi:hypothetical protein
MRVWREFNDEAAPDSFIDNIFILRPEARNPFKGRKEFLAIARLTQSHKGAETQSQSLFSRYCPGLELELGSAKW